MCFSAEASFAASAVLAAGSIAIARLPKRKAAVPLSLFPALFSVHQFIEGTIWLSNDRVLPGAYQAGVVYAYVAIAFIVWPLVVPFSAYLLETERKRRAIMLACQAIGAWVAFTLVLTFLRDPVQVSVYSCRLAYYVNASSLLTVPYLVAVCLPFLAASELGLRLFGMALALACAVALLVFSDVTLPSVWCFFAALLSAGLYLYFRAAARTAARGVGQVRGLGLTS